MEQLRLFGVNNCEEWTSDDWQTPTRVAKKICNLIQPDELTILEPSAGCGQIVDVKPDIALQDGSYFESISRNVWCPISVLRDRKYVACQLGFYLLAHFMG